MSITVFDEQRLHSFSSFLKVSLHRWWNVQLEKTYTSRMSFQHSAPTFHCALNIMSSQMLDGISFLLWETVLHVLFILRCCPWIFSTFWTNSTAIPLVLARLLDTHSCHTCTQLPQSLSNFITNLLYFLGMYCWKMTLFEFYDYFVHCQMLCWIVQFLTFWIQNFQIFLWLSIICNNQDFLSCIGGFCCLWNADTLESWENGQMTSHQNRNECSTFHLWSSIVSY